MKSIQFLIFCQILFATIIKAQHDPHFTKEHNVIVHLFEWTWKDIAEECERFLHKNGYGAVQISPPNENLILPNRPWYERYQPVSYIIKTRSGDEESFKNMTRRCNNAGVRIYADAVINHMSAADGVGTAGSYANAYDKKYPSVPYGPLDFHDSCMINNYQDINNVRNCDLEGLKDLNHGKQYVREKIVDYMNHLIDLGVAGFRIDAAKHMWPEDLKQITTKLKNLNTDFGFAPNMRPFIYQEVIDTGGEPTKANDYTHIGAVLEFRYSNRISNMFNGNDKLKNLHNWGAPWSFLDDQKYVPIVFIDNHDTQRNNKELHYKNHKKYKMANAFMLAHPYGIPKVMSSYHFENRDQGPPKDSNHNLLSPIINPDNTCGNGFVCEHRWRQIHNMVKFRNIVNGTPVTNWWSNGDQQIAFCRGNLGFVAFTQWGDLNVKLQTCLPPGKYCDIISGDIKNEKCTGRTVEVRPDGKANIVIKSSDEDGVLALISTEKIH